MAQGYYEKLYKQMANRKIPKSDAEKLKTTIANKKTRLNAAGIDTNKALDKRNGLEKALGLPDDQNFVFDIFELLGRPQQALFGAINAAQNGEDAGEAAWKHFKGEEDTNFKEILKDAGMSDRKGKLDLVDVLGFGGDVLLDPMDIVPVAGFGKFSKALKAGDNVKDASKLLKTGSDLAFEGAGKALKGTAKVADKSLEKGLEFLDKTKGVKDAAGDVTKIVYETPMAKTAANLGKKTLEGVATSKTGRLELYKDLKDSINKAFNYSALVPKTVSDAARKSGADTTRATLELEDLYKRAEKDVVDYAKKIVVDDKPETLKKAIDQVDQDLHNLKEFKEINREVDGEQLLKEALSGKLSINAAGEDGFKLLNEMAESVNFGDRGLLLKVDVLDDGMIKLNDDWKYLTMKDDKVPKTLKGVRVDPELFKKTVVKNGEYSPRDIEEFGNLLKKYENDDDFKELYDKVENIFNEGNKIVDKNYGTNMATKYGDNKGYVRHAYNKDQFSNLNSLGLVDDFGEVRAKGKAKVLADRKFNMSAREANNMFRESISKNYANLKPEQQAKVDEMLEKGGIFKEGLLKSFDSYLENVPKLAKDSELLDSIAIDATFGDHKMLKDLDTKIKKAINSGDKELEKSLKIEKAEILDNSNMKILSNKDNIVPRGFKQLSRDEVKNLAYKLEKMGDELGLDKMKNVAKSIKANGNKLAVNEELIRLIDISGNKKETKAFVRMYDKFLNFFKKNKVLSPTFQMNNFAGNTSNMYLAGISPTQQAKLFPEAVDIFNKGQDVLIKSSRGVKLTPREEKILEVWNGFIDAGFGDPKSLKAMDLADMPEGLRGYFTGEKKLTSVKDFLVDGLPYLNNKMNNYMDTLSRLVTFMEGQRNPSFLKRLGVENAGEAVRKINFDPTELTPFERSAMKRLMPFYTFTKKNLAFQVDNLSKNGSQYHKLLKGYDRLLENATGDKDENVADWLKNNLYIPIPSLGEDGSYKVIRTSLPLGNLIDTATDVKGTITGTLSPLLRMPIELKGNINSFTETPIEKFEGEMSKNIPFMTKKNEYLLGNLTGLDVPLKNASRIATGIQETLDEGNGILEGVGEGLLNTVTMENNTGKDKMNKMYEELDELETLMQQYKQRGYEFSTINELKKANKNTTTDRVMATLNKLNGIKANPYTYKR